MRDERTQDQMPLILGVFFTIIAVIALVSLVVLKTRADITTQGVAVANVDPTLGTVTISNTSLGSAYSPVILVEANTVDIYAWVTATDLNGYTDLLPANGGSASAVIYRNGVGNTCGADESNCKRYTSANYFNGSGNTVDIQVTSTIQYYWDPTDAADYSFDYSAQDVKAYFTVTDSAAATANATSAGTEFASLTSLNITTSIDYGTIAWSGSAVTSTQQTATETNSGNRTITSTLQSDADFACTLGSLSTGYNRFTTSSGFTVYSKAMSNAGAADLGMRLVKSSGVASTQAIYGVVAIPAVNITARGACGNNITATAGNAS